VAQRVLELQSETLSHLKTSQNTIVLYLFMMDNKLPSFIVNGQKIEKQQKTGVVKLILHCTDWVPKNTITSFGMQGIGQILSTPILNFHLQNQLLNEFPRRPAFKFVCKRHWSWCVSGENDDFGICQLPLYSSMKALVSARVCIHADTLQNWLSLISLLLH